MCVAVYLATTRSVYLVISSVLIARGGCAVTHYREYHKNTIPVRVEDRCAIGF